jgi:putative ABC transport system permease protein
MDLRFAIRALRKSPGFTVLAVVTLALGIGAASAAFSVVHAVLVRALPYPESERLVMLWEQDTEGLQSNARFLTISDCRERAASFEGVAAVSVWTPTLVSDDGAERLHGESVSADFLRVMGVRPFLGRVFEPEEDRPQHNRVVVLGYGLWQRRFGADAGVVGRTIRMGETPYTVVGVMPPGFESSLPHAELARPQVWRPLGYDASLVQACRDCRHLRAVARLAPGATLERARAELATIQRQIVEAHPDAYASAGVKVTRFEESLVGSARPALLVLLALVALLLLIAWVNLASLFLARAAQRQQELAVQLALGASRLAILRQRVAESLLIALAGGALGLALGRFGAGVLLAMAPAQLPRLGSATPGAAVTLAAFGLSVATTLVLAFATAVRAWRVDALDALGGARGASAAPGRRRFMGALIVADVALCLVLLTGAGLLGRSLLRLLSVDAGFDRHGLLTMEVALSGKRYAEPAAAMGFHTAVLERLRALPGVTSAAVVSQLPLGGNFDAYGIHAQDKPSANPADDPSADRYSISPDYLSTLRIPLLRGRSFTASDHAEAEPVVLVNQMLAERVWPGEDPLGKQVRVGGTEGPWRTVVGVVGDVRHTGLDAPRTLQVYLALPQFTDSDVVVAIRATIPPAMLAHSARAAIGAVDPTQAVSRIATIEEVVADSTADRRFTSMLAAAFALLALLLAGVGVAGVVSRSATDRTREIGIRLALGALPSAVRRLVLSRVARLTLAGAALGTFAASALAPLLGHVLFGVTPLDPVTFSCALALVVALPLLAGWWPARRAARLDPLRALHQD